MSWAQRIVNIGMNIIYPIIYFGSWRKDRIIYKINNCKFKLRVGTSDKIVVWEVFKKKEYTRSKDFRIGTSDVVVDIGGHIGSFTILAAKQAKAVYTYEPFKDNFDLLNKNVALNGVKNVKSFNLAVSDAVGKEEFFIAKKNMGGNSLYKKTYAKEEVAVQTTTLERIFSENNLNRINFLKIDAEGAEYRILLNVKPSVLKKVDKICLEYHDNISTHGHTYRDLVELLESNGFSVNVPTPFLVKKFVKIGRIEAVRRNQ